MAAILLGIALSVLDSSIVNLALPDITRHFGASPAAAVWVVNAYQLATLGVLLPCAQLGERFGYKRVYVAGLAVFTVASLACVLAPTLPLLAAARALQGVGAAGMMAVNAALVRLTYPSSVLGRGIALNSVVVAASSVAGPSLAALVLSVASWPWLFIVQLPLDVVVFVLARRALPRNARPSTATGPRVVDVAMNIAMFSLVFLAADAFGARKGGAVDARGLALACGMLALGGLVGWWYLRRQRRLAEPLFPVDLLRIRVFALSMCTSVSAFSAQTLAFIALPFLLLEGQGRSHFQAGLLITAWPAAIVLVAPVAGRLIHRIGGGVLGGVGLALLAIGLALLALLPDHPADWRIALPMALCGAGFGLFQSPNNHTIVTSAPLHRAGAASGMLGTARLTGQSLGAVLLGLIFSVQGVQDGGPAIALGLAAALAAASAVFSSLRVRAP
ncbi:MFS transporter [Ramlibacter sp. USB13]|uniref:MFS transporter n=1 Tax=Ramlibacter cellulosilyticus TaxID=2764187 RepID=A0A923SGZ7_9BURK|nr:MFS transporter [Ramlibacter cellulosilyticus]MBC5785427.1 MFS transporter [Ramlibacter cellulosilyticus]